VPDLDDFVWVVDRETDHARMQGTQEGTITVNFSYLICNASIPVKKEMTEITLDETIGKIFHRLCAPGN
jgi:hypothetical protein